MAKKKKDNVSRAQSLSPTICGPMDCSPPGSPVHGILQARILEWIAISFSRGSSQPRGRICISCVSCIGRQILYHSATRGVLIMLLEASLNYTNSEFWITEYIAWAGWNGLILLLNSRVILGTSLPLSGLHRFSDLAEPW